MSDRLAAERACKDANPIIDGRKANVNLAYLGAKPRGNLQAGKENVEFFVTPLNIITADSLNITILLLFHRQTTTTVYTYILLLLLLLLPLLIFGYLYNRVSGQPDIEMRYINDPPVQCCPTRTAFGFKRNFFFPFFPFLQNAPYRKESKCLLACFGTLLQTISKHILS